ncbi:MAG TPA: hypothetical protein VE289_03860 [Gaiellaceae bacterium]|nr:hypothetical protein [Gaiellaceae bacterium]
MILAHHAGEELVLAALSAGGTTAASGLVVLGRAKLGMMARWLLRR